jgi:hypothetical protein
MKPYKCICLIAWAVVCLALVSSTAIGAEVLTVEQLYEFCTSKDEGANTACRFFIFGAVLGIEHGDGFVIGVDKKAVDRSKTHFCLPDNVPDSTMVSVFVKFTKFDLTKYPEDAKLPAISWVDAVMMRAYPCK